MFNRFVKDAREVAAGAFDIARGLGSSTVEAEHLLLALADRPTTPAHELLSSAGLDPDAIASALDQEREQALAAIGVVAPDVDPPAAKPLKEPKFGSSAKLAIERSLKIATARSDRRIAASHILLGLLQARLGTVPRALKIAGVDRLELAGQVEADLDAER